MELYPGLKPLPKNARPRLKAEVKPGMVRREKYEVQALQSAFKKKKGS